MNFKILEVDDEQICIHRDLTDDGQAVCVTVFLHDDEGNEYLQETTLTFDSGESAVSYVEDFSEKSAARWLEGQRQLIQ